MGSISIFIAILAAIAYGVSHFINIPIKRHILAMVAIGGLGLGIVFNSFIYVEKGKIAHVTYPTGTIRAVSKTGINLIAPFSRVTIWDQYVDIACRTLDEKGDYANSDDLEGIIPNGISVRFIDQVTGNLYTSVRFEFPTEENAFIALANKFKTQENLVVNTLIPTIREQSVNVSYMFSAENYVSGDASNFKATLEDALKNGGFEVRKQEVPDTTWDSNIQQDGPRKILEVKRRTQLNKILGKDGKPIRVPHEITENKILVSQVIIDDVLLEQKFREKLETQRDISAQKRIEAQKVETAVISQQRIIAEGERDKAKERVDQEKEQVKALISIETKLKQEDTNRKLAEIALQTERLKAEAQKVAADAQAYENAKLVSAGLTPQEKAQIEMETKIGIAQAFSKMAPPTTFISGGNGGTATEALIQAAMAKQLIKD